MDTYKTAQRRKSPHDYPICRSSNRMMFHGFFSLPHGSPWFFDCFFHGFWWFFSWVWLQIPIPSQVQVPVGARPGMKLEIEVWVRRSMTPGLLLGQMFGSRLFVGISNISWSWWALDFTESVNRSYLWRMCVCGKALPVAIGRYSPSHAWFCCSIFQQWRGARRNAWV